VGGHSTQDAGTTSNFAVEPRPIKWVGVVIGGFLTAVGIGIGALGIALFPEDPPGAGFIILAGSLLAALGLEVMTQSLGNARPWWWPEHIIRRP